MRSIHLEQPFIRKSHIKLQSMAKRSLKKGKKNSKRISGKENTKRSKASENNKKQRSRARYDTNTGHEKEKKKENEAKSTTEKPEQSHTNKQEPTRNIQVPYLEDDTAFIEDMYLRTPDPGSSSDGEGLLINRGKNTERDLLLRNMEGVNHILETYRSDPLTVTEEKDGQIKKRNRFSWEVQEIDKKYVTTNRDIMTSSEICDDEDGEDDEDEWDESESGEIEGTNKVIAETQNNTGTEHIREKGNSGESQRRGLKREASEKQQSSKKRKTQNEEDIPDSQESEILLASENESVESETVQVEQSRIEETSLPNSTRGEGARIGENPASHRSNRESPIVSVDGQQDADRITVVESSSSAESEDSDDEFMDATEGEAEEIIESDSQNTSNSKALVQVHQNAEDKRLQLGQESDSDISVIDVELDDISPARFVGYDNENCLPDYISKFAHPRPIDASTLENIDNAQKAASRGESNKRKRTKKRKGSTRSLYFHTNPKTLPWYIKQFTKPTYEREE